MKTSQNLILSLFALFSLNQFTFSSDAIDLETGLYHNQRNDEQKEISNIYIINQEKLQNISKVKIIFLAKFSPFEEKAVQRTELTYKEIVLEGSLRKSKHKLKLNSLSKDFNCSLQLVVHSNKQFEIKAGSCSKISKLNFLMGEYEREGIGKSQKPYQEQVKSFWENKQ